MIKQHFVIVLAALAMWAARTASGGILTFDEFQPNAQIDQTYGDDFEPNIDVGYRTLAADNQTTWTYPHMHATASNGVNNEYATSGTAGHFAEISFVPTAGWQVRIVNFQVGSYLGGLVSSPQTVRILDEQYNSLLDEDYSVTVGSAFQTLTPNVTHAGTVRIQFSYGAGNDFGLDNIQFSQVAVPEPSTLALSAIGFIGWGLTRRAWRRVKNKA